MTPMEEMRLRNAENRIRKLYQRIEDQENRERERIKEIKMDIADLIIVHIAEALTIIFILFCIVKLARR